MKEYKVYQHSSGATEAVKQGWSWPAFFFPPIWAMVKKMWGLGVGSLIAVMVMGGIAGGLEFTHFSDFAVFFLHIIFGVNGQLWREKNLIARGFKHVDTVTAADPEGAIALFLESANAIRISSSSN